MRVTRVASATAVSRSSITDTNKVDHLLSGDEHSSHQTSEPSHSKK